MPDNASQACRLKRMHRPPQLHSRPQASLIPRGSLLACSALMHVYLSTTRAPVQAHRAAGADELPPRRRAPPLRARPTRRELGGAAADGRRTRHPETLPRAHDADPAAHPADAVAPRTVRHDLVHVGHHAAGDAWRKPRGRSGAVLEDIEGDAAGRGAGIPWRVAGRGPRRAARAGPYDANHGTPCPWAPLLLLRASPC